MSGGLVMTYDVTITQVYVNRFHFNGTVVIKFTTRYRALTTHIMSLSIIYGIILDYQFTAI